MAEVRTIEIHGSRLRMDESAARILVKEIFDQFDWQDASFLNDDDDYYDPEDDEEDN